MIQTRSQDPLQRAVRALLAVYSADEVRAAITAQAPTQLVPIPEREQQPKPPIPKRPHLEPCDDWPKRQRLPASIDTIPTVRFAPHDVGSASGEASPPSSPSPFSSLEPCTVLLPPESPSLRPFAGFARRLHTAKHGAPGPETIKHWEADKDIAQRPPARS